MELSNMAWEQGSVLARLRVEADLKVVKVPSPADVTDRAGLRSGNADEQRSEGPR
jgi:hypothetical protein